MAGTDSKQINQQRPNIIFINVDQWRGDCLGFTGHPVVETPHLDALASQGVNFRQAYSAVPSCVAARAAILTGLSQRSHGRVGYMDGIPWTYEHTLPGLLADAGYHTQAIGKMHVSPARNLMGFHNVILHDGYLHHERIRNHDMGMVDDYLPWLKDKLGYGADYADNGLGCNGYVVRPWIYDEMLHPTAWVTTQAIDFLRRRDTGKPFFMFVSYHRPHPPLDPPAAYLDMYANKEPPPLPEGDWNTGEFVGMIGADSPCPSDLKQRDRARRAYYSQMTFIDHQINRLVMSLYRDNLLSNTVFLFCADHGDMLFDHNMIAKSVAYEGAARVPFFLSFPHGYGIRAGTNVNAPVELRDILPTLCDLAGVKVPESIEGRSLIPFCRGENPEWREHIHGEHVKGAMSNHWVTNGKMKYVWLSQTGEEQLFDLTRDPQELHNLASQNPDELNKWRQKLIHELTGREEGYVRDGELVVGCKPSLILKEAGLTSTT